MEFQIYRNIRLNPDEYEPSHECGFCNNFSSTLVELSPKNNVTNSGIKDCCHMEKICKTCLQKYMNAIDNSIQSNFQTDFEEARKKEEKKPKEVIINWNHFKQEKIMEENKGD